MSRRRKYRFRDVELGEYEAELRAYDAAQSVYAYEMSVLGGEDERRAQDLAEGRNLEA